ncbi:MAG: YkvA family protein [Actinomycetota bacterium]|nr:DUF1232 domain-containing protein [Actinomycetota bacterium]
MHSLLVALAVTASVWIIAIALLFVFGRKSAARELATLLPNLVLLFKGLLGDDRVPRRAKILLWIGVVWAASPIDLIPEFIPVIGPLDDAIMAALVLRYVVSRSGREVVTEHWRGDEATLRLIFRVAGLST